VIYLYRKFGYMVICFNCSSATKQKLDMLVSKGGYSDYTAAISAAIENQLLLEERVAESGSLILRETPPASSAEQPQQPKVIVPTIDAGTSGPDDSDVFVPFAVMPATLTPTLAEAPKDEAPGVLTPDRWLFGQYNKFLPVKANCRLAAQLLRGSPSGISFQALAQAVQQNMPNLRHWLEDFDYRHDLGREASLATAFPTKDTKSILRYTNQFVMSINKSGTPSGFPVALGLLNRLDSKTDRVSLTEAGLQFSLMPNPVLDPPHQPDGRFSTEETHFLLAHIRFHVPREHGAYITVLRFIAEGASNPEALDGKLKPNATAISGPYLSTQRSGVISRLTDLGLVSRQRDGIRVNYCLTREGRAYLNEDEAAVA
jgi:hypothetical protein